MQLKKSYRESIPTKSIAKNEVKYNIKLCEMPKHIIYWTLQIKKKKKNSLKISFFDENLEMKINEWANNWK